MPLSFNSPQVVWFSDPDGEFTYCNDVWYEYTGLRSDDLAAEKSGLPSSMPSHRERIMGHMEGSP